MSNTPTDVAQQALDAAGIDYTLGDIENGTREGQVILRAYRQCLMQLHRAVHWDMARKQAPLTLLADSTGQTSNVGTLVPTPWAYEYSYPTDCMKARFIPWQPFQSPGVPTGNIQTPQTPLMGGMGQPFLYGQRVRPARFLVATDYNYPAPQGSQWWEVQGVSPQGRTVILTNVQNATLVYTCLQLYPNVWDAQFRAAFVAYLASEIALPLTKDKKFGLQMRAQNIAIAKEKITQARISDGNEGLFSSDISVDWMRTRNVGGGGVWGADGGGGPGYGWCGCDQAFFADGSCY
jgi:hypothetical protein